MEAPGFDQEVGGQETCRSQGILREEDFCLSILLGIVTRFMICFLSRVCIKTRISNRGYEMNHGYYQVSQIDIIVFNE